MERSPFIALNTDPPFYEYHFIDTESRRAKELRKLAEEWADVFIYSEDCNKVQLREVFPRARYGDYHRALWLLEPSRAAVSKAKENAERYAKRNFSSKCSS